MTDAISRSAVMEIMEHDLLLHESEVEIVEEICTRVRELPALDVAPVAHAEWTEIGGTYTCSSCGGQYEKYDHMGYWNDEYKYCPHCGARMDKEE